MICQSWERAKETERLGKWLKANYVRIEPLKVNLLRDKKIAIFKEGKPSRCCGLLEAVPSGVSQEQPVFALFPGTSRVLLVCVLRAQRVLFAQLYEEYLATGGPDGGKLPPGVVANQYIQNQAKFCGLLNSLGEQSFAEDSDMTRAEARARKNHPKGAKEPRKFGTKDNKELTGLMSVDDSDAEDEDAADLQPTSSRSVTRTRHTRAPRAGLHYRVGLFLTVCPIAQVQESSQEEAGGGAASIVATRRVAGRCHRCEHGRRRCGGR